MRKRLTFCSLIVAVVGLCSALLIYLTAGEGADGGEGFEIVMVDGKAYPIPLADTKMYRRELQRLAEKWRCFSMISIAGLRACGGANHWRSPWCGSRLSYPSRFSFLHAQCRPTRNPAFEPKTIETRPGEIDTRAPRRRACASRGAVAENVNGEHIRRSIVKESHENHNIPAGRHDFTIARASDSASLSGRLERSLSSRVSKPADHYRGAHRARQSVGQRRAGARRAAAGKPRPARNRGEPCGRRCHDRDRVRGQSGAGRIHAAFFALRSVDRRPDPLCGTGSIRQRTGLCANFPACARNLDSHGERTASGK